MLMAEKGVVRKERCGRFDMRCAAAAATHTFRETGTLSAAVVVVRGDITSF
jgi:hypothetical protein